MTSRRVHDRASRRHAARARDPRPGDDGMTRARVTARAIRTTSSYYPRSGKISFRGVGVIGRIEQVDYWDGED